MTSIYKINDAAFIHVSPHDYTLGDIKNLCPLDNRHDFGKPNCTLGVFEQFPRELFCMIFNLLDLQSVTNLRRVNKQARLLVDSIPEYKTTIECSPTSIQASLSIGSARWFSCRDLYEKLVTAECDICGDFGGYLYLVTCRRVCYRCFTENTSYQPLLEKVVLQRFGLHPRHLDALPSMQSLRGTYSTHPNQRYTSASLRLFDYDSARQAGISVHGSADAMEKYASNLEFNRLEKFRPRSIRRRQPLRDEPYDHVHNPNRFMGIIRAPFLKRSSGTIFQEWGFNCFGCNDPDVPPPCHTRRLYTAESFKHHTRKCGEIINGKHI